jgi:septum formation protein
MFRIYLASASPRRSQLLDQIRVAHDVVPVDLDESRLLNEPPGKYVQRLAADKARTLWERLADDARRPVLGADTTVALDGDLFGKPANRGDGLAMLERLAGRTHRVFTAVTLWSANESRTLLSESAVTFAALSDAERIAYWETGEPLGKAGGYAVQGMAAAFITRIVGSYSGIMGLPLAETAELLRGAGWSMNGETNG